MYCYHIASRMYWTIALILSWILLSKQAEYDINGGNQVTLIHIPKTGGTTFEMDLQNLDQIYSQGKDFLKRQNITFTTSSTLDGNFCVKSNEKCYYEMYQSRDFNVIIFRNPRDHVHSQYLEIKYDTWGKRIVYGTAFPIDIPEKIGFDIWLDHFNISVWGKTEVTDYNAYNPINMQARYITCRHQGHHIEIPTGIAVENRLPRMDQAYKNLKTMDLVGITEFYPEFLCVFLYRAFQRLPARCNCRAYPLLVPTHHATHNIPRHSWMRLYQNVTAKIDEMTKLDRELYRAAIVRFLRDVRKVEAMTKVQILCPEKLNATLNSTLSYLKLAITL